MADWFRRVLFPLETCCFPLGPRGASPERTGAKRARRHDLLWLGLHVLPQAWPPSRRFVPFSRPRSGFSMQCMKKMAIVLATYPNLLDLYFSGKHLSGNHKVALLRQSTQEVSLSRQGTPPNGGHNPARILMLLRVASFETWREDQFPLK